MNVLVACEFSGIVRDAFAARGHNAWSCDLLPSERPGNHIQGDAIVAAYSRPWDLMIAHPPSTYLSRAGARHRNAPGRVEKRDEAIRFAMALWNAPIQRVCMENPEGYMRTLFRRPDQVVNPFEFGHAARKKTLLWLRGLPPLFASLLVAPPPPIRIDPTGKRRHFTDSQAAGSRARSRTFQGIAEAMADQWGHISAEKAAA